MPYPGVARISELAARRALHAQLIECTGKFRKAPGVNQLPPRLRAVNPDAVGLGFPEILLLFLMIWP
eukprot:2745051-Pyramimonas_sp.AAC.1